MRILVTGAAGKVGSEVVRTLVEAGHEVVATDIQYREGLSAKLHLADLGDINSIYPLADGCDAVLHMGNHPHQRSVRPPHRILTENTAMNTHVFTVVRDLRIKRLVFISSIQACAKTPVEHPRAPRPPACVFPYLPLDGNLPAQPGMNMYAMSKALAEQYLQTWAAESPEMSITSVRLPYVHVGEVKPNAFHFSPVSPHDQRLIEALCYLPISDACSALQACVENDAPGFHPYFITRSAAVAGMTPSQVAAEYFPHIPVKEDLDALGELVDLRPLRDELGWVPSVPLVELTPADSA